MGTLSVWIHDVLLTCQAVSVPYVQASPISDLGYKVQSSILSTCTVERFKGFLTEYMEGKCFIRAGTDENYSLSSPMTLTND